MGRGTYKDVGHDVVHVARAAVKEADEDYEEEDEGDAAEGEEDPDQPFVWDG